MNFYLNFPSHEISCRIEVNEGLLSSLKQTFPRKNTIIISDTTVHDIYRDCFPSEKIILIPPGETAKEFSVYQHIIQKLIALDAHPGIHLIGIGGGVVCDITGFIAGTFMRGVKCSFVPTTLMAQVDAAIGGKNGINVGKYKNILGLIRQPECILIDPLFLASLPDIHLRNGLFEIIKYGLIADTDFFHQTSAVLQDISATDTHQLLSFITRCIEIKNSYVMRDPYDKHERRMLNFGHTFAHALELDTSLLHGYAVGHGMLIAAAVSVQSGIFSQSAFQHIKQTLQCIGLSPLEHYDFRQLFNIIRKDKKRDGNTITYIMLKEIGSAHAVTMSYNELMEHCEAAIPLLY